jgi:hypothetical protein
MTGEGLFVILGLSQDPVARDSGRRIESVRSTRHTTHEDGCAVPRGLVAPSATAAGWILGQAQNDGQNDGQRSTRHTRVRRWCKKVGES